MFLLSNSTDLEEIGLEYPQIQKMSIDYPNYSAQSVQLLDINNRVDYTPFLNSFVLENKSKPTDLLSFYVSDILIVTEKLLKILLESNIINYQYFEADVIHRKKHYKYYLFFIYGNNYDLVDYKNMTFWGESQAPYSDQYRELHERVGTQKKEIKVNKIEQLSNWQKLYPDYPNWEYQNLIIKKEMIHTDMIRTPNFFGSNYYVSEKLKAKIVAAQCTGLDFKTKDWRDRDIIIE